MRPKFKKGDRVLAIKNYDGNNLLRGVKGTVMERMSPAGRQQEHAIYAVCFDLCVDGHSFGSRCKMGYGYYLPSTHLKKIR